MSIKYRYRMSLCAADCFQRCHRYLTRNSGTAGQQQQQRGASSANDTTNYYNQANNNNDSDSRDESSWSYNHRRHTRKSYEHKRANLNLNADAVPINNIESLNHYQRLNIQHDADNSDIKSAYYSLSKIYHPDVVGSDATDNFRLITESYDTLSDPKRRAEYDKQLNAASDTSPIEFSAWNPDKGRSTRSDNLMRSRNAADIIYKMRQEAAALEQERLKNPRKFRAGSFDRTSNFEYNRDEELSKLDNRLKDMDSYVGGKNKDISDFYRSHAKDTILRRRSELNIAAKNHYRHVTPRVSSSANEVSDMFTFWMTFGLLAGAVALSIFYSLGTNIAALLDDSFQSYKDRKRAEADERKRQQSYTLDAIK